MKLRLKVFNEKNDLIWAKRKGKMLFLILSN
ncbi:MAG: hypothetical protein FD181_2766 [Prolixibacteraceae bacterium]|nr:MAG: hypothetical protein FD181_2766 [Prolixibacteraceae bacterium]